VNKKAPMIAILVIEMEESQRRKNVIKGTTPKDDFQKGARKSRKKISTEKVGSSQGSKHPGALA